MSEIETLNAMRGLAKTVRAFYTQLVEEGFSAAEALTLTGRWVEGLAGAATR